MMNITKNTILSVFRRPELLAYTGIFFLITAVNNRVNPLITLIKRLMEIGEADLIKNLMTLLQYVFQLEVIFYVVLIFAGVAIVLGPIIALLICGFLFTANNAVSGGIRKKSEFIYGIKKYYKKTSIVTIKVIFSLLVVVLFFMVASVPLMAVLKTAFFTSYISAIVALIIGLLTVIILFLVSMFYRSYILFWYSALINGSKKPFKMGKKLADKFFWRISFTFMFFDIVFVIFYTLMTYFDDTIYVFAAKIFFNTFFFTFVISYILAVYAEHKRS